MIKSNALIYGSHVEAGISKDDRGRIVFARTRVGKETTVCSSSVVSCGTELPDGATLTPGESTGGPRPPRSAAAAALCHDELRTDNEPLSLLAGAVVAIFLLLVHSVTSILEILPSLFIWLTLNQDFTLSR